ncbi:four-carbon acid sugar kinase family protein [Methylobrevis pamukkalensis]|uniref:four-carbon acid sugar kinase family protein n=1 Tax=Methylobrevis pamukkalensis TaxID=1439726 RepID=UPI001FDAB0F5|nr:four-carbon acid sugar kinase family protein [Methylobrevis pamukkalensis]
MALVADDLTGALDSCVPFALAGLSVAVALRPDDIAAALATGAQVVGAVTASRAMQPGEAAVAARDVGRRLCAARPQIVFKKIDSRLKGNLVAETAALAEVFARGRAVIAPAVPDQGRFVVDGDVIGNGVGTRLGIAAAFAGLNLPFAIADTRSDADLDGVIDASHDHSETILVAPAALAPRLRGRLEPPAPRR